MHALRGLLSVTEKLGFMILPHLLFTEASVGVNFLHIYVSHFGTYASIELYNSGNNCEVSYNII